MRTGKRSQQLLDGGRYPVCLNLGFEKANGCEGKFDSPLDWFGVRRRRQATALWLCLSALVLAVGLAVAERYSLIIGYASEMVLGFVVLIAILYWVSDSLDPPHLKLFERDLSDVLVALHPQGAERPVHLLTLDEVKERAAQRLISIAYEILRLEKAGNAGMPVAERRRDEFRAKFDLFKEYGLTGSGGYEGCFGAAKQKLREETYVSPRAD